VLDCVGLDPRPGPSECDGIFGFLVLLFLLPLIRYSVASYTGYIRITTPLPVISDGIPVQVCTDENLSM
jgi:hypothetical protein